MLGAALLAVLALVGKSPVMFVSATAIAVVVYIFRRARLRDRAIAIIAAALGGSIGAEIVHTVYHYTNVAETGAGGDGGFFMTALFVGLINSGSMIVVIFVTEAWLRFTNKESG